MTVRNFSANENESSPVSSCLDLTMVGSNIPGSLEVVVAFITSNVM